MGVPSFYRWLINKYPKIIVHAVREKGEFLENYDLPNKNGEFENFYIDMNGIIHPCFHPDHDLFPPTTWDEVFDNIFEYIDLLFDIVRPRRLLYLALDGVAPRAKMNQQRARRFRTAKDNSIAEEMEETLRKQFEKEGKTVLTKEDSQVSDSNVITPGTEFMFTLSRKLECYIRRRINSSAAWRDIKVILSDGNAPGEGEHKIMSFIRAQRTMTGYDPNTRHCLYGLDADLIMLALATHEMYFSILREDVLVPDEPTSRVSAIEQSVQRAEVLSSEKSEVFDKAVHMKSKKSMLLNKPFQFLHVWILREYLELDMEITDLPEKFVVEFERVVDDFVFICFFAGNDFLPHIPSLEIHEGAIDLLMHVYKKEFKNLGGYLVDLERVNEKHRSYIKLKRVERFILCVGQYEDQIFAKRSRLRDKKMRRILSELADEQIDEDEEKGNGDDLNLVMSDVSVDVNAASNQIDKLSLDDSEILRNTKELKHKLKDQIRGLADTFKNGSLGMDKVKLGVAGWKERYYKEKFSVENPRDIETTRKEVVSKYGEGLCWVLLYYFSGVPSWTWFYPYHYAPFASDFKGLSQLNINFQQGRPFKPFDQLMGVLPPRSAHALPVAYRGLMIDESSKIIDFYPSEFEMDIDGKRFTWQAICKLPFIDEERLLTETMKNQKELKDYEIMRNMENPDKLFVRSSSKLGRKIRSCSERFLMEDNPVVNSISSFIHLKLEDSSLAEVDTEDYECTPTVLCISYETPQKCVFVPKLLSGVEFPDKTVFQEDVQETNLWHEQWGNNSYCGQRVQNQGWQGKVNPRVESSSQHYVPEVQNQEWRRKVNHRVESSSKHSASEVIMHRNPGTGLTYGRGRAPIYASNSHGYERPALDRPVDRSIRVPSQGYSPNSHGYERPALGRPFDRSIRVPSQGWCSDSWGMYVQQAGTNHSRYISNLRVPSSFVPFQGIDGRQISEPAWVNTSWQPRSRDEESRNPRVPIHGRPYLGRTGHAPGNSNFRPSNNLSNSQMWRGHPQENTNQPWQRNQPMSTNYTAGRGRGRDFLHASDKNGWRT